MRNYYESKNKDEPKIKSCSCKINSSCPLDNNCNSENIVYLAEIHPEGMEKEKRFYIGVSKGPWKTRYNNHTHSFRKKDSGKSTALSNHYWYLIDKGKKPKVKWKILKKTKSPDYLTDRCYLCLEEATRILRFPQKHLLLNKRSEITAKCMHQREMLIKYTQ